MEIKKEQIIAIQTVLSKDKPDRDERLDFLSQYFGYEIKTTKDLTFYQAMELLHFLNTGEIKSSRPWGYFDFKKTNHRKVASLLHELQWITTYEGKPVPDVNRLGNFLKSKRSPVIKPLLKMSPTEVSKIISALEGMLTKKYAKKNNV